jgi:hypothetical protein
LVVVADPKCVSLQYLKVNSLVCLSKLINSNNFKKITDRISYFANNNNSNSNSNSKDNILLQLKEERIKIKEIQMLF